MTSDDYVIQLALDRGVVSPEQLAAAQAKLDRALASAPSVSERTEGVQVSARFGVRKADAGAPLATASDRPPSGLLETLKAERIVNARQVAGLLAEEFNLPLTELQDIRIAPETLQLVPRAFAVRHDILPLAHDERRLRVAVGDPLEREGVDRLCYLTGLEIMATVAPMEELRLAIAHFYGPEPSAAPADHFAAYPADNAGTAAAHVLEEATETGESDAPIVILVQAIIHQAVLRQASDIHFEPMEKRFRVRYRIDGVLIEVQSPAKRLQASIVSRLKIMANISIAEKRIPQDGRIQVTVAGRSLDLRVSSLPTAHGESIVMRLLDKERLKPGLGEMGFSGEDRERFERLIKLPDGMLLVTGPTGSGKTTTLYSCLHHLNQADRKIITVEDPVEYQLAGINQVPVRQEIGMTFAAALRAMLRQAPNIVMVGEIRDRETAEVAINASLTGHMVFSTLHTNDAPGAITRLIDMGVKPFLVSTSLRGVLAQRLVRRICPACSRSCRPKPEELRALNIAAQQAAGMAFRRGDGCAECNGTGYRGRVGIFELLVVDDEIRMLIHAHAGTTQLREKARSGGSRTLREDGLRKISAGLTTIEEVVSITIDDGS